ncbi:hypothetical protein Agabi119p4_2407 [Agaricus bisporus var. burnettii]|uniref:Uncharacterized protein n=1 Tax=Agaricus bisporus var. burnettii TaxID=192524 RepID=A0A8H7KK36_AGABI|nr:hypothetical protein Agabi119p4_2407 [Agaricus bisporus var. burnettii]
MDRPTRQPTLCRSLYDWFLAVLITGIMMLTASRRFLCSEPSLPTSSSTAMHGPWVSNLRSTLVFCFPVEALTVTSMLDSEIGLYGARESFVERKAGGVELVLRQSAVFDFHLEQNGHGKCNFVFSGLVVPSGKQCSAATFLNDAVMQFARTFRMTSYPIQYTLSQKFLAFKDNCRTDISRIHNSISLEIPDIWVPDAAILQLLIGMPTRLAPKLSRFRRSADLVANVCKNNGSHIGFDMFPGELPPENMIRAFGLCSPPLLISNHQFLPSFYFGTNAWFTVSLYSEVK